MEQEKILAAHVSHEGFLSRIGRELLQNNKRTNSRILKMGRELEQAFLQRRYANGHLAPGNILNVISH